MKNIIITLLLSCCGFFTQAQSIKGLLKNAVKKDSLAGKNAVNSVMQALGKGTSVSTTDVISGLKEALSKGVNTGTLKLSAADGFFKDAAVKILLPPEAGKVESTLRGLGLGHLADDAILSINRAAEDAAKSASPVFLNAIKQMSIQDGWSILKGSDTAATSYLRTQTSSQLSEAFRPIIEKSLVKSDATKYWTTMMAAYNKVPLVKKINPDLSAFVTDRAISGVFYEIGQEEILIRKDPLARTSDILKKVFE